MANTPSQGQLDQVSRLVRESGVGVRKMQWLIENANYLQDLLEASGSGEPLEKISREDFRRFLGINPYFRERCSRSAWSYDAMSHRFPSLEEQANLLEEALGISCRYDESEHNKGRIPAKDIALIPCLNALGGAWGISDVYGTGYGKMFVEIGDNIFTQWSRSKFHSSFGYMGTHGFDPDTVRLLPETREAISELEKSALQQGFNCLALPVSMGWWGKHCYSLRNSKWQMLNNWGHRGVPIEPVAGFALVIGTNILETHGFSLDFLGVEYNWQKGSAPWSSCLRLCIHDDIHRGRYALAGPVDIRTREARPDCVAPVAFRYQTELDSQ